MRRGMIGLAAALVLCAVAAAGAGRADAIAVTEFPLPVPNSAPRGIATGSDGNVWFTEVAGSRVGRVTPAGQVTDFSNGAGVGVGGEKWDIAAGPDGNLWYTDQKLNVVGRMTPPASAVEFPVAVSAAGVGPRGIASGPDGNLWIAADAGAIIRVTPAGVPTEFTAGITIGSRPVDIAAGPDGALWFTELSGGRIGRITTAGAVTEFPTGIAAGASLEGIAAGPDGALWFTEPVDGRIGRISTAGVVAHFPAGSGIAQPSAIAAGPDGNLWFTDVNLRRLGRITTQGVVTEYPLTLANAGRPRDITAGPNRDLWITTSGTDRIARVRLGPAVSTGAASAITNTTARIAGTIDPFASSTGYVVQYGRTTAYGSATAARIVPPSAGAVGVTIPLSGLAPGTRYHYRLVGSSFGGTTEGADATFVTTGAPGTGGARASGDRTGPRMRIAGAALVARGRRVLISLGCPLTETLGCRGRVRLLRVPPRGAVGRARTPLRLGGAPFRIGGGQTKAVAIRLTRRAQALLRARGALRVRAVVRALDAAGNDRETGRRLVLRRPAAA